MASDSPEPLLACDGLVKTYGDRRVVDAVSFSVAPGETYGLLGPNGAGKTTTISIVAGILGAEAGTVRVAGHDVSPGNAGSRAAIGLVPQEIALYPDLSGRENLRFFGRLQGLKGTALKSRVDEVLEVVGLGDRAGDALEEYSGGMKRRCNIAAGMLHRPRLLILDEPTVGVDPQSRNAILAAVEQLAVEGMAVLYTTHYMEEAERLCDRVGILDDGVLVAEGTRDDLVEASGLGEEEVEVVTRTGPDLEAVFLALTGKALRDT